MEGLVKGVPPWEQTDGMAKVDKYDKITSNDSYVDSHQFVIGQIKAVQGGDGDGARWKGGDHVVAQVHLRQRGRQDLKTEDQVLVESQIFHNGGSFHSLIIRLKSTMIP